VIDSEGYRANVGIILSNPEGLVFWGKRAGQSSWQFPQGGIRATESPEEAMYRELQEETGLRQEHVHVLGRTDRWLRYRIPDRYVRRNCRPVCIGQKQIWYMLTLVGSEEDFNLVCSERPEFDGWRWVPYWYPLSAVVHFKREVYDRALREFAPLMFASWTSFFSAGLPRSSGSPRQDPPR